MTTRSKQLIELEKMGRKECKKCGLIKPLDCFRKNKNGNHSSPCKECVNAHRKQKYADDHEWRERLKSSALASYQKRRTAILGQKSTYRTKNRKEINEKQKRARENDPDHFRKLSRASYDKHKEKRAAEKRKDRRKFPEKNREINRRARKKNPEKIRNYQKKYYQQNKKKILNWENEYRKRSPQRNISTRLRNRINTVLRYQQNTSKSGKTEELLGCSVEQLKSWLESQFTNGMNWELFLQGKIHIDHIEPCASFDLTSESEQKVCFNWKNLQPLWAKDNLQKGSKRGKSEPRNQ